MRFALIGCGEAGSRRASAVDVVDGAEIVVYVDSLKERAVAVAANSGADVSTDWRATIIRDDVDAVIISTTNDLHAPISIAAAEAGKHILCERPLARNPVEAAQIAGAVREHGVKFKTGFSIRHHPTVAEAKKLITDGRIGKILFIRGKTGRGSYAARSSEWMVNCDTSGGGTLLDNGCDLLDLCRYFMGNFHHVMGQVGTMLWPIRPCEDNAFAIMTSTEGPTALIQSSWTDWQGFLAMDITGTEGYIKMDFDDTSVALGARPGAPGAGLEEIFDLSGYPDRSRAIEIEELMHAVEEDREPTGGLTDGVEAVALAHAIYRSSESGAKCLV